MAKSMCGGLRHTHRSWVGGLGTWLTLVWSRTNNLNREAWVCGKSLCVKVVPIRPPPLLQKVRWKFGYEALMAFHVPINFAHCSGVSTLKGAYMNQKEGGERGKRREEQK